MLVDLIPFQGHNDGDEKKNENFKSMASENLASTASAFPWHSMHCKGCTVHYKLKPKSKT